MKRLILVLNLLVCSTLAIGSDYQWKNCKNVHLKELFEAIDRDDRDTIRSLIESGLDINLSTTSPDWDGVIWGITPLMLAAQRGCCESIKILAGAGANVNAVSGYSQPCTGTPVLQFAIDRGSVEATRLLIQLGARVNAFTSAHPFYSTKYSSVRNLPLVSAAINSDSSMEIIEELIRAGADVNKKCMFVGYTPLMIATLKGNLKAVKILLSAGAEIDLKNDEDHNRTALDYALQTGCFQIAQLIKNHK